MPDTTTAAAPATRTVTAGGGGGGGAGGAIVTVVPPVQPPAPPTYVPTHYQGTLPAAVGDVAKAVLASEPTPAAHRTKAEAFFAFLTSQQADLRDLNADTSVYTALVSLPNSNKVKVLYGTGIGTRRIGATNPTAGKLLALFGEGGGILGPPQALVLDSDIGNAVEAKNLTPQEVETVFQGGNHAVTAEVMKAKDVQGTAQIHRLCPIPSHMVLDGFVNDLDAAEVYERVMDSQHDSPMRDHALQFLRTCMIGTWRSADTKPFVPSNEFFQMAPPEARVWAVQRFQAVFPALHTQGPPGTPTATAGTAPGATQQVTPPRGGATQLAYPGLLQLNVDDLKQLLAAAPTFGAATVTPEKDTDTFKVSTGEKARFKRMCGLQNTDGDECFPKWFRDLFDKHQDDISKNQLIADAIDATWIMEDADVPMYPTLLRMIRQRNWTGGDLGKRPALVNASAGLSPFAMMDLTEEDVAEMKLTWDDLTSATTVSASDHKAVRTKLKATTPTDDHGFMLMLKRFTNFLYALFSSRCPLYIQMYGIVKALRAYSPTARENLSHEVRTSILWIILIQSRWFAQGKMVGDTACLGEFATMVEKIKSKTCGSIMHDEVPTSLLSPSQADTKKRKDREATSNGGGPKPEAKIQKTEGKTDTPPRKVHPYNKDLAEFFKEPMEAANHPSLATICTYCGITQEQLLSSSSSKDCRTFLVLGKCRFGRKCIFDHRTATKPEVQAITEAFQKFKKDPLGCKGEQKPKT